MLLYDEINAGSNKHPVEIWKVIFTMPDHSIWCIPAAHIARNRAEYYKDEFDGDVERSLLEDTIPLFRSHPYEIMDWYTNNMDWKDIKHAVFKLQEPTPFTDEEFDLALSVYGIIGVVHK